MPIGKRISMMQHVAEGRTIPRGYGLAYWSLNGMTAVCYPMPLNVIVSLGRRLWIAVKQFGGHDQLVDAYIRGEAAGRARAHHDRYLEGIHAGRMAEQADLRALFDPLTKQ